MLTWPFCSSGPSSFLLATQPEPPLGQTSCGHFRLACPEPQPGLNKHSGPVLPASALGKAQPGAVEVNPGEKWEGGGTQLLHGGLPGLPWGVPLPLLEPSEQCMGFSVPIHQMGPSISTSEGCRGHGKHQD